MVDLEEVIETMEYFDPARVAPYGFTRAHPYLGKDGRVAFEPCVDITIGHMLVAVRFAARSRVLDYRGERYSIDRSAGVYVSNEFERGFALSRSTLHDVLWGSKRPAKWVTNCVVCGEYATRPKAKRS